MNAFALLMSLFAVLASVIIVYFQYYHRQKISADTRLLSFLRFISILSILLILINPKFERSSTEIVKPKLFILSDNSSSIAHNDAEKELRYLLQTIQNDKELTDRFTTSSFIFSDQLSNDTAMGFTGEQTNIHKAIADANALGGDQNAGVILLKDGTQTFGSNYAFMQSRAPVYPIVLGDTMVNPDVEISRINVNAYANLDNNFPVEIFLNAKVKGQLNSTLLVEKNGKTIYSAPVSFSAEKKSDRQSFYLPADSIGMHLYEARIRSFEGEKNTRNNSKRFGVEILDEQALVAVVYSVLHPDVGMIKRSIESNRQRKVKLIHIDDLKDADLDYSLYVLYQPNLNFSNLFNRLKSSEQNLFVITGRQTDLGFINEMDLGVEIEDVSLFETVFPVFPIYWFLFCPLCTPCYLFSVIRRILQPCARRPPRGAIRSHLCVLPACPYRCGR